MFAGKTITLIVTGSIAAYKSAELVRELVKQGSKVQVVMTKSAKEFISPLTLQTLSGNVVTTDLFDETCEAAISHIQLADTADLVLVLPATADFIARAASGIADDAGTTVLLATRAPVLIAPAMNVNMWEHALTKKNVSTLKAVGYQFIEPGEGELACGWYGEGRLADFSDVFQGIAKALLPKDLSGIRVVVSAGPTREAIDAVRFVSNRSSGKMGYALARVAALRGANVHLVSGPTALEPSLGVKFHSVTTAQEMRDKIFEIVAGSATEKRQLVFMAAAVTDHRPSKPAKEKLKADKSVDYSLQMTPCSDILKELGEKRDDLQRKSGAELTIVGFAAETGTKDELISLARHKLEAKKADFIVANLISESFEKATNRVWLLSRLGGLDEIATADKDQISATIFDLLVVNSK